GPVAATATAGPGRGSSAALRRPRRRGHAGAGTRRLRRRVGNELLQQVRKMAAQARRAERAAARGGGGAGLGRGRGRKCGPGGAGRVGGGRAGGGGGGGRGGGGGGGAGHGRDAMWQWMPGRALSDPRRAWHVKRIKVCVKRAAGPRRARSHRPKPGRGFMHWPHVRHPWRTAMRIPLLCAVLVLACAACDRREEQPAVDPASTGTVAPADTTVPADTTTPDPTMTDPSMPPPADPNAPATPCAENDPNCVPTTTDPAT